MSVNQVERASRAWPILVGRAAEKQTVTYGGLAGVIGVHHRPIRNVLEVIQAYCLEEQLPPLTILVVNQNTGLPGTGFIAHDLRHFDEGKTEVFDFEWRRLENPFAFSSDGSPYDSLVAALLEDPDSSEDVYGRIRSRGIMQILFREALMKAYGGECAFTGISIPKALEACHIIPWECASEGERLDVRNGILLNSFHHRLFDHGLITVSANYEIIYRRSKAAAAPSDVERTLTSGLHGTKMKLPFFKIRRPRPDYITRHHELAEWEHADLEV